MYKDVSDRFKIIWPVDKMFVHFVHLNCRLLIHCLEKYLHLGVETGVRGCGSSQKVLQNNKNGHLVVLK